jgi:hypothetical protein
MIGNRVGIALIIAASIVAAVAVRIVHSLIHALLIVAAAAGVDNLFQIAVHMIECR